jgi:uncharacterized protein (DUF1778 family)
MKSKMTGKRLNLRVTEDDERALKAIARAVKRPWMDTSDVMRLALETAERALSGDQASRGGVA